VSITELARRLVRLGATADEARQTAADYLELVDEVVAIDERVAFAAFAVGCETPARLPLADAVIAAAAHKRGACLVHRDSHMAPIPAGLVEQIDLAGEP